MIFLMTKDSFLLQGFWQLKDNHEMIKINSLSEIKKVGNKPFKVIIDTYHNHILDEEAIKFLEKLDAERIIVLAPYHISKLKAKAPIYFVSRKESIKNLLEITYGKHLPHKNSQLCFSHNQFKIMQLILKNKNESNITSTLIFRTNIKDSEIQHYVQAETKTYERHRHPGYHILFLVRT